MGMIMVIGIVAKNGILLLDADQKMRKLGLNAEDAMLQAARQTASHRDDRAGYRSGNAPAGVRHRRRIADAAAAGDCSHRWRSDLDGPVADHYAGSALLPRRQKRIPGGFSGF